MKALDDSLLLDMSNVLGELVHEYGVPILSLEQLTLLGKRAVAVYGLQDSGKKITFPELCSAIKRYITTPFGAKSLQDIQKGVLS